MPVLYPSSSEYPAGLRQLAKPPPALYIEQGDLPLPELLKLPRVAIVGSRRVSPYGKQVTMELAEQLAARGIVIISGLALGVDGLAHRAALAAGGLTLAVLPTPLNAVAPYTHRPLARDIVAAGGALVTEYPASRPPERHHFVERNRIVAALTQVLVITEAAAGSGSLHTAQFALELSREVLAVPGNITSPTSVGTHNLIKTGAGLATGYKDVLYAMGLEEKGSAARSPARGANTSEQIILDLLGKGITEADRLFLMSKLAISDFNQTLTMLQIGGRVRSLGGNQWAPI